MRTRITARGTTRKFLFHSLAVDGGGCIGRTADFGSFYFSSSQNLIVSTKIWIWPTALSNSWSMSSTTFRSATAGNQVGGKGSARTLLWPWSSFFRRKYPSFLYPKLLFVLLSSIYNACLCQRCAVDVGMSSFSNGVPRLKS